ncbi:hypothetical protein GCM10022267_68890 [Lentzea roselyniae]|uniref:Hsp70 protein n=1 Tax=Lentzea roselyniae TaxID=531940 RepID=A0ABP7BZJ2_9PSEU
MTWAEHLDAAAEIQAIAACTAPGELIFSADPYHLGSAADPHRVDGPGQPRWREPVAGDGDHAINTTFDLRFGTFAHPWEDSLCVWGADLLQETQGSAGRRAAAAAHRRPGEPGQLRRTCCGCPRVRGDPHMSYQVGLDLGSAGTTVATERGVTTATRRHPHAPAKEIAQLLDDLTARYGEASSRVAMTHPLSWPHEHLEQLRQDLIDEGRADVLFVPAPHAAAIAFDACAGMPEHSAVAVFDFGATAADVTMLRKQGVFLLAGRPERVDIGGFDLDDLVVEHVTAKIGTHSPELVRSCVEAKELLGSYPEVRIPVVVGAEVREVRLSRLEFEAIIRPSVELAVAALERVVRAAGLCEPDVILLVGGSARIPLVVKEITERLGIPVLRAPDGAAATGAFLEARQLEPEPADEPTVWVPAPREEAKLERRIPTTPFIAAGLLAVAVMGGWAAHEAMNQPKVMMETTSVELAPPGTAVLPRF